MNRLIRKIGNFFIKCYYIPVLLWKRVLVSWGHIILKTTRTRHSNLILRLDGTEQLIVLSTDGEVRGYAPGAKELRGQLMDVSPEQKLFQELNQKKLQLMQELKNYDLNDKVSF